MSENDVGLKNDANYAQTLGNHVSQFVSSYFPAYTLTKESISNVQLEDSVEVLNSFTFYKIVECSIYKVDDRLKFFSDKLQRLFTAAYTNRQQVCYGVVSQNGTVSLLLGVAPASDDAAIKSVMEGLLPGIKLEKRTEKFDHATNQAGEGAKRYVGCISGVPALKVNGAFLHKDLASLIRSLNNYDYTIMVMCNPIPPDQIQTLIDQAVQIQDNCFAISKNTVAMQSGSAHATTHQEQHGTTESTGETTSKGRTINGGGAGALAGAAAGAAVGSVFPVVGTAAGAVGGGLIGLIAGKQVTFNKSSGQTSSRSITDSYSDAVSDTITNNKSISLELQNGYAIDLMNMAESVINRLKVGRSIGMWQSVVSYSSTDELAKKIIQGSLYSEIASSIPTVLPPVVFDYNGQSGSAQQVMIPKGFFKGENQGSFHSLITSEELCGICTIPTDETFGFDIRESRGYAINARCNDGDIELGHICEYDRELHNIPFGLSTEDINKHTFVCGITGSGKTNTVKSILEKVPVPYLVIEPAKKEYRNMGKLSSKFVYTLGRPKLNCLQLNPFYILPGVSPQQHIDLLKDLFSASFAFYGPMPYILEKCLNTIYLQKGWNLTAGFHPSIVGKDTGDICDSEISKANYKKRSHQYLFPTMQDLKKEVDRYVEQELSYEGEVKGNIRGAIKARIDSLCIGAKGYIFNTHTPCNMEQLVSNNTVLELEGLADDDDKAFALGLLIIFLNEYRQSQNPPASTLSHILVIEEAHRLLRRTSFEPHSEGFGNPQGKAVEHFTNMLAEMRAYGQGVIVVEQIPSKLAPDVIKNSSNKIVHRLVSRDDQEALANTIGVPPEDAIYFGNRKNGYALCHKEGMVQPVIVKIRRYKDEENRNDYGLYNQDIEEKYKRLNCTTIRSIAADRLSMWAIKFLVSVMYEADENHIYNGIDAATQDVRHQVKSANAALIPGVEFEDCFRQCLLDEVIACLSSSTFKEDDLPDDDLYEAFRTIIAAPTNEKIKKLNETLTEKHKASPKEKVWACLAGHLDTEYCSGYDIKPYINDFSLSEVDGLPTDVIRYLQEKRGADRA